MTASIAIIDSNTLSALGLRSLLVQVMPFAQVDVYGSLNEFLEVQGVEHVHYFVNVGIVLENSRFFLENRRRTIVLTQTAECHALLQQFHCLCVCQPEEQLVCSLLALVQHAHGRGQHLPPQPMVPRLLSDREQEVLALIVQGHINKEIADRLHLAVGTVLTHRRNIHAKLNVKSVAALTIYAVMHGIVALEDVGSIR